jgi:hypothetical protein
MFLGTPHRGSKTANEASVLTGVVNVAARFGSLGMAKNPLQQAILSELKTGSIPLRNLHDTFRKRVSGLQVKSFFETKDTVIRGKSLGIVCDSPFTSSWGYTDNSLARLWMRYPGPLIFHKMIRTPQSVATSPSVGSVRMKRRRSSGLMSVRI